MKLTGLTSVQVEQSRREHGSNTLTQLTNTPLWKKFLLGFTEPMIMILLIAFAIELVLSFMGESQWFEPVGVFLAVMIANGVSSVTQHKQEIKSSVLRAEEEARERTKVIREDKICEIPVREVVVGDVVYVQSGDKFPADGEVADGRMMVDQAVLNGETEEAEKISFSGEEYDDRDLLNSCYVYRGTVVCEGSGYMTVKKVGDNTLLGELALEVQDDKRITPLQLKLGKLAKQISVFGYIGAALIAAAILIKSLITGEVPGDATEWVKLIVGALTIAITIIVCAVPEGLPMLTSVLLSLQSMKMAKDNVLVRNINGIETAGSLSILFTDKTGTITEGRLSVAEVASGTGKPFGKIEELPESLRKEIARGIGINNSSCISEGSVIGGNSTDRALLGYLMTSGQADAANGDEIIAKMPFDSNTKLSTVTLKQKEKNVTYIKGAPEKIISGCSKYIDEKGNTVNLTDKNNMTAYINLQASRSMRIIAVAKTDDEVDSGELTLICLISIRDKVRDEAAQAIRDVRDAGVQVVMITGDRKETAVAIAKESGLIEAAGDIALSSAELNDMTDDEVKEILPRLRVVARALPLDKSRLVHLAQELDLVVGMTGDGVNDSPALKKSDVGFAMGSGTEVAKTAGDITILDDNFLSIEKAILYGRSMFKSIRRFLIFQLTVNVAAVLTCFIGALLSESVMFTVVQLLFINLVMDTLAAVAFGSEAPEGWYMKEKPVPRRQSIVTGRMMGQIITGAVYITLVCLGIRFLPEIGHLFTSLHSNDPDILAQYYTYLKSAMFACFMMMITFNGFNARTERMSLYKGLRKNKIFIAVFAGVFICQFLFVSFGGEMFGVTPLSVTSWLFCLIFSVMVIPLDLIRKLILRVFSSKDQDE